ncbi:hypothetical protein TUSST3_91060 [Streptomyces sp. TUS-ST3]|uniref:hypothetical protein n=1 Tax=Streptomyces sp. TUS-ST3 TaxID=3025591 RepID=UPI00235B4B68|nr:hypothetical protein [Streptomyces sp. TUS-ST3]GLP72488.1 hypothetical protein TUSST3_91060 [Streptomyces sp. TUS-ST3]
MSDLAGLAGALSPGVPGQFTPSIEPGEWRNSVDSLLSDPAATALTGMLCHAIEAETANGSRSVLRSPSSHLDAVRSPGLRAVRALLRGERRGVNWQTLLGRDTGQLLTLACDRLMRSSESPPLVDVRRELSVDRAQLWCQRAVGHTAHYSFAMEMAGLFTALCTAPESTTVLEARTTFLWGVLAGISEYYAGTVPQMQEIGRLAREAVAASRRCVQVHGADGELVVAAQMECGAVQLVDNLTGILQLPDLFSPEEYIRIRGADIGVHIYTVQDDRSEHFREIVDETTMVAVLAHDLIDQGRDTENGNLNNLVLRLPDSEQLWDILEVCLSHTCAVGGKQWQRVVAGFVVGTCLYARGGRERVHDGTETVVHKKLRPSVEWTYAPRLYEYFSRARCSCTDQAGTVNVGPELDRLYADSSTIVRGWLRDRWDAHFDVTELQRLALACASAVRTRSSLFSGRNGAEVIP